MDIFTLKSGLTARKVSNNFKHISNYFIKNDADNQLIIFQLKNTSRVKYGELEKHLGLPVNSITEATQATVEDIIGVSGDGLWTTETHRPRFSKVLVIKDKSLMGLKPKDFEVPYSLNPWKTKPYEKLIELISSPNVK